jgi:hypothetical protein
MPKGHRLYAPFFRNPGERKWIRLVTSVGTPFTPMRKEAAVRRYQSWLLDSAMGNVEQERCLRPLTDAQVKEWREYWLKKRG